MAIKPQSAKAKGRRHQQWVRDKILALFPKLEPDDVRSTGMGQSVFELVYEMTKKSSPRSRLRRSWSYVHLYQFLHVPYKYKQGKTRKKRGGDSLSPESTSSHMSYAWYVSGQEFKNLF